MGSYKASAVKLSPAEFKAIVDVVKFWDPEHKKIVGKLIRHNAWVEQERAKVEQELRDFRQVKIDESITRAHTTPPRTFFTAKETIDQRYDGKGHRLYEYLKTQPTQSLQAYLKWNGTTIDEAYKLANEYAERTGKEKLHDKGRSHRDQDLDP